jgi:spore coat polysaccharide biosynthesis predicted glycosyltransferase SpsG
VILGIGYPFNKELRIIVDDLNEKGFRIELKKDVKIMAKYIANSDLAITSNGRTLYEVASLGIPCISICQNEREVKHLFPQICKGIINLGIAFSVSEDIIASALARVIGDYQLRKEMHENMLKFDLKNDTVRTLRLIFDRYWEWKENEVR